jgi:short-subunit dehydrogenase
MTDVAGRHVLLTGASRGLGAAMARRLAARGARLTLVARDVTGLEDVAAAARQAGAEAQTLACDLGRLDAIADLVRRAEEGLGPVDVLINNAGVEPFHAFETQDPGAVQKVVDINLTAAVLLTSAVTPGMLARGRGHLVFLASTAGGYGTPYGAVYSATKAALWAFATSLRLEYAGRGVLATAIAPGFVKGAGMFEAQLGDRRRDPPWAVGFTTAEAVVDATLDALAHDRPDVVVNRAPMRPVFALGRLFPALVDPIMGRLLSGYMRWLARAE